MLYYSKIVQIEIWSDNQNEMIGATTSSDTSKEWTHFYCVWIDMVKEKIQIYV